VSDRGREKVATAAWILCALIRLTLGVFDHLQVSRLERGNDFARNVKPKVQRDGRAEQVVDVDHLRSGVKGQEKQSARLQDSPHLVQNRIEVRRIKMHDRIERDGARKAAGGCSHRENGGTPLNIVPGAHSPAGAQPRRSTSTTRRSLFNPKPAFLSPAERCQPILLSRLGAPVGGSRQGSRGERSRGPRRPSAPWLLSELLDSGRTDSTHPGGRTREEHHWV